MPMTRRRRFIILGVLLVAVVGVGVYLLMPPKPGVTRENFRRLHKGMTSEQVQEIIGVRFSLCASSSASLYMIWEGGEGKIQVEFIRTGVYLNRPEGATSGGFYPKEGNREQLTDESVLSSVWLWIAETVGW